MGTTSAPYLEQKCRATTRLSAMSLRWSSERAKAAKLRVCSAVARGLNLGAPALTNFDVPRTSVAVSANTPNGQSTNSSADRTWLRYWAKLEPCLKRKQYAASVAAPGGQASESHAAAACPHNCPADAYCAALLRQVAKRRQTASSCKTCCAPRCE